MESAADDTFAKDERARLDALAEYQILDTGTEPQFDDICALAANICDAPMAVISLIDDRRQWFKSRIGIHPHETPRDIAFCLHAVQSKHLLVVDDARRDPCFADNPLVTGPPGIRFYAGAPLLTHGSLALGALAVMDCKPRSLSEEQLTALQILSREVVAQLELRKNLAVLKEAIYARDCSEQELRLSHRQLEQRVAERTRELKLANASLEHEAAKRGKEAEFLQALIDSLPGVFYLLDEKGRLLRWNKNLEFITGYARDEIPHVQRHLHAPDKAGRSTLELAIKKAMQEGSATLEAELLTRSGQRIPYYFTGARIELDGKPCIAGMGIDITERLRSEENLRLRDLAIQSSVNAIIITDLEGNIEDCNPAFERITGYSTAEAIGRNCRFLQDGDRDQTGLDALRSAIRRREEGGGLLRNYRKNGELFWNDVHIAPVRGSDGSVTHFVGVLNDVSEIKWYEQELDRHATVDALTALANRSVLHTRIKQAIAAADRYKEFVTIGFIDLDNFKFINDSLGHSVGDELLKQVAERLTHCLRGQDTLARYGGDEFAFVLIGQKDENSIAALMERILRMIGRPFHIAGNTLYASCSIGLSFFPKDGGDVDTLLKNADAAMHRAKESGRNNFQFYTASMNRRVTERLALESRLRQALANEEFALHYQPKVDLRTGAVTGVEALLRWHPAGGEWVPPGRFIPLAEETGLIVPIGEWVLRTACAAHKALQDRGLPRTHIAVNISARQFEPKTLLGMVRSALSESGLDPCFLELELTESLVMRNPEDVIEVLHELRAMGLLLAIDDFGTGYSSLSYLQRFPVDRLKIDQSFVRDLGADPSHAVIARAVISLGHSLGMTVVAEGVSSQEQLAFLRDNGCDEMQGFLYSHPLPLDELARLLGEGRGLPAG